LEFNLKDKNEEIADTLSCFFDQFGSMDLYTQIVIEEIFKELMDEPNFHIPSEERQEDHKANSKL
jgi:hypothetical protein